MRAAGAPLHPEPVRAGGAHRVEGQPSPSALTGAERRALEKEAASLDRRLEKANAEREGVLRRFESADHSDYDQLAALQAELAAVDERIAELEEAWLEAHEGLER